MKKFILILLFCLISSSAWAANYYVRTDGGTSTECTGLADDPYDGSGSGEACAYEHPFYWTGWWGDGSINDGGVAPAYSGGDDLIITCNDQGDCTGVTFNVGYDASWTGMNASWTYGGYMRPIVDGTGGNHTTIKGCSSTGCATAADRPGFTGMGRNQMNINLKSSDYVDIEDIDVYDTATCGAGHALYGCGSADASEASVLDNINLTGATNISLKDMRIAGAYRYGIYGGGVNTITFNNTYLEYNSFGGWDADSCGSDGTCGMAGTIAFQNGWKIRYNGCVMTGTLGTIASEGCYSQDQTGYGDGLGTHNTGGDWVFQDGECSHNVSDCIDLLYHNRGAYSGGSISIKRVKFEGNAGNNIKVSNNVVIEDVINIANCAYFNGQSFTCTSGSCGASFNNCRASGNPISIEFKSGDNSTPRISSITMLTNSDVAIQTSGTCTTGIDVFMSNSAVLGGTEFNDGSDLTSIFYDAGTDGAGANCNTDFIETNNICYNLKEGASACPGTNSVDGTGIPDIFSGTIEQGAAQYYDGDDYAEQVYLSVGSIARGVSDETFSGADSLDLNSFDRGAAWDAGALEYGSTPSGGGGSGSSGLSMGASRFLIGGARIQKQ